MCPHSRPPSGLNIYLHGLIKSARQRPAAAPPPTPVFQLRTWEAPFSGRAGAECKPREEGSWPFIPHWTGPSTLFDTQNVPRKPSATYPSSLDSHSEGHGQGHSRPEKGAFEKANPNCVSTLTVCVSCSVVSDSLQPHGL